MFKNLKKQFEDALVKSGVEEITALGNDFDPNFHEAVMTREADGPDHQVIEVVQKGYTLFGKLLRPAMVIVSKRGTRGRGDEKTKNEDRPSS